MKVRRYYKKGVKYPYTISEEYYEKLKEEKGEEEANRIDNAEKELVLETKEEQYEMFMDSCNRVYANPRYYLDNLDKIPTFKVNIQEIFPEKIPDKWEEEKDL